MAEPVTDFDLPALYQASDRASIDAQRTYLRLAAVDLGLIVVGGLFGAFALEDLSDRRILAIVSASLLALSLVTTIAIRTLRKEQSWYEGRAVAESVKTLSWRYMTKSEPYSSSLAEAEADQKFATDLWAILQLCHDVASEIGGELGTGPQITRRMRDFRAQDTAVRRTEYLKDRIDDQRQWYASKASVNQTARETWLWRMMAAQFGAMIFAIVIVAWPDTDLALPGALAALAAACWGWLQLKQHQELSKSYAIAAQELGLIAERAQYIDTDDDLSSFVTDAENAVSREHTLWLARRDHRLIREPR